MSRSVPTAPASHAAALDPGAVNRWIPLPAETDWAVMDAWLYAPPVSAVPHPAVTVRVKPSAARVPGGTGATTVTDCVVIAVAPTSSVTVRRTVYVPGAA